MPDGDTDTSTEALGSWIGRSDLLVCNMCVFYLRLELGDRVLKYVEKVILGHRRAAAFELHSWPCDVLEESPLAGQARAFAGLADVVVVASDGNEGLPPSFREWLDLWQSQRVDCNNRLLALFHPKSPDRLPAPHIICDLVDFASSSGVAFVWCDLPEEAPELVLPPFLGHRA
ncbi:MAG TPA: hypothetical protein VGA56_23410 [Opitutaceae bacterium]